MPANKPPFDGEWVRLGELCAPKQWKSLKQSEMTSDGYPVYGANGVIGYYSEYNHEEEAILVGCRGTCGEVNLCAPYSYVTSNAMCLDRLSDRVDRDYLICFLKAYNFGRVIGGTSQPQITKAGISSIEVPLFSLEKQIVIRLRLKSILDELVSCKALLAKLDTLVKSRFVEMFGDPTVDHDGWPYETIGNVCQVITGNTPSRKDEANYGDSIEWCKTDNITDARYLTRAAESLSEAGAQRGRIAPAGSVLMACIAGSIKTIGKVAINDRPVAFNQQINALIPMDGLSVDYLLWALRLSKDYLCSDVNMQLKGILNKSALSAKRFAIPPLALQQEFADFVAEVDKSRFIVQQKIEKLQTLYDSLAQKYFG